MNRSFLQLAVLIASTFMVGCFLPLVEIEDTDTETDTQTQVEIAENIKPSAAIDASLQNTRILFDGTLSSDEDGSIESYQWFLNNQLISEDASGSYEAQYNGLNFLHLVITDDRGDQAKSSVEIFDVTEVESNNTPPMITQIVTTSGVMANFEASQTIDDSDGEDQLSYTWLVDGQTQSEVPNSTVEFGEGVHVYELQVTDSEGLTATTGELEFTVNEQNNAPLGEISVILQQNRYVKFDAINLEDLDGEEIQFIWDFGDGYGSTKAHDVHRYELAGVYNVTLRLFDGHDFTTMTKSISVSEDTNFVPVENSIIENGDVEDGLTNWDTRGGPSLVEVTSESNSGNSALLISGRMDYWEGIRYTFSQTLTEGNEYELYAWVKLASGNPTTAKMTINFKDARGAQYTEVAQSVMSVDEWTLLYGSFKYYGQGTVSNMNVYLEAVDPLATYYVDDFALTGEISPVLTLPDTVNITVDLNNTYQFIDGFGATTPMWGLSSWSEAQTQKLVGLGENDLGLSILRTSISPDQTNWSDYQPMLEYADSNISDLQILGTPWSPPAHMKSNDSITGGGRLFNSQYTNYARHLDDFVIYMKEHNVTIDVVSIQSEPDYPTTAESCEWTGDEILKFVRDHANWINDTKVLVGESFNFDRSITDPVLNDETGYAQSRMEIVGAHLFGAEASGNFTSYPLAEEKGMQVWMTEWFVHNADEGRSPTIWGDEQDLYVWDETLDQVVSSVHKSMLVNWNAYIWWWAKRYFSFMGDGDPQFGTNNGDILKRGWAFSHYSKYVRPGALRVKANVEVGLGLDVTSYQKDGEIILVMLNRTPEAINSVSVGIDKEIKDATYVNTSQFNNRKDMDITYKTQSAEFDVPARSISTVVIKY